LLSSPFKRRASHICCPDFSHLYYALTWKVGIFKFLLFLAMIRCYPCLVGPKNATDWMLFKWEFLPMMWYKYGLPSLVGVYIILQVSIYEMLVTKTGSVPVTLKCVSATFVVVE
jgi:hypothetical protein